jgi:purine-binding chemotaxis protein CheW
MITQVMTFQIGTDLYGIEVLRVQEVTGTLPIVPVPLAPKFVHGLINLRGQIATALGLRDLFELPAADASPNASVVCKLEGSLVSLLVDSIGDVMEVQDSQFERPPEIVPLSVRKFIKGVYKTDKALLSVIDLEKMSKELFQN